MKKINELTDAILRDEYRAEFERLYGSDDGDEYNRQKSRYMDALSEFKSLFDVEMAMVFSAPGRSEICGNHTDHQSGMALAASVSCDMIAIVSERDDNVVSIISDGFGECVLSTEDLQAHNEECGTTKALVRGILSGFKMNNYEIGGFNAYVTSDVLSGSGLSSSAAFEILMGTVISELYNKSVIPPETLAKIGQFSENRYFGKPCGLLDQLACAVGGLIFIDFKDTDIISKFCDFSDLGYSLCITATGGSHDNLTDEYAAIPSEMKAVAAFFNKSVLREVEYSEFIEKIPDLRRELGDRAVLRALHFFEENKRVITAYEALKAGNTDDFLEAVRQSGNSSFKYLQNVYVPSNRREQNMSMALSLSEIFLKENGVCRVHGGGFAGTILAIVKNESVACYRENMEKVFGKNCMVMNIRPCGGIKVM